MTKRERKYLMKKRAEKWATKEFIEWRRRNKESLHRMHIELVTYGQTKWDLK